MDLIGFGFRSLYAKFYLLSLGCLSRATPPFPGQCKEPLPVCEQAEIIRDCFVHGRGHRVPQLGLAGHLAFTPGVIRAWCPTAQFGTTPFGAGVCLSPGGFFGWT